jgi:hypothetical protein
MKHGNLDNAYLNQAMSGSIVTEARTIHIYDRGKNNSLQFMKTYMIKFME